MFKKRDLGLFSLHMLSNEISYSFAKGGATKGAAGGAGVQADDFTSGHYSPEEMNAALFILTVIMCIFFAVCACQWLSKMSWECSSKWSTIEDERPMPCAPYTREGNV